MVDELYFSYLSLYIETSAKQLISYGILSLALIIALVVALTRLKELRPNFNVLDAKRGWLRKRLQFVGVGMVLALLIAGISFNILKCYFYERTIEIVSRSDFSSVLTNVSYGQFFTYMIDWVTIPTLDNELPLTHLWTTDRLSPLLHIAVGMVISALVVEWYIRQKLSQQTVDQTRIYPSTTSRTDVSGNSASRADITEPKAGIEERVAHDIYETIYRRRHTFVCSLCGRFFNTEEELEEHSMECTG